MFSNCLSPFSAAVLKAMTEATCGRKEFICVYSSREPGVHDGGVKLQWQKQEDLAEGGLTSGIASRKQRESRRNGF